MADALTARWFILIGTLWSGPGLSLIFTPLAGPVVMGGYLALAGGLAILIGGVLQISQSLKELSATTLKGLQEV